MRYHIFVHSLASGGPVINAWVVFADPDAHHGRGYVEFSKDRDRALLFENQLDAWDYWRRPSRLFPTRVDGKQNRPMTAYTVTLVPENEEPIV